MQTIRKAEEGPLETVTEKRLSGRGPATLSVHPGYRKDEEMDVLMKQLFNSVPGTLSFIIGSNSLSVLCCLPPLLPGKDITLELTRECS